MTQQRNDNARVYSGMNSSRSPVYFGWSRSPNGSTPSQLDLVQYAGPQDRPRACMNGQPSGYHPMQAGQSANQPLGYQYPQGVLGAGPPWGSQYSQGGVRQTLQVPPTRGPIRGGAYNFSNTPVRSSRVWFCCASRCGFWDTEIYVQCIICEHRRCPNCPVEHIETRDPCYGQRQS